MSESKRPHIVIFNPDQWRGDVLGHVGNPAAVTPNLDRTVATDGVSFSQTYCQNPVCTPSRCSFMTGWYPHTRGHRSMKRSLRLPDETNLLKVLKDSGYWVWWGGKNDLVPAQHGFEQHCDVKYSRGYGEILAPGVEQPRSLYAADRAAEWRGDPEGDNWYSFFTGKIDKGDAAYYRDWDWANVEGAIEAIHNHPDDKPMCLFLAIAYPHPPYGVEEPWYSMIDRSKLPPRVPEPEHWADRCAFEGAYHELTRMGSWSGERWTELRAVYYAMCARVDHQYGLVMQALREAGIYDDTAVFLFPDHGDWTGDMGLVEKHQICFEDSLTRVPMIIKPPADVPVKPRVCDAMVELIDFPATVEELAGVKLPHAHFGRSLLPLLAGATDTHRDAVFCQGGRLENEPWIAEADPRSDPPNTDGLYGPKVQLQYDDLVYCGKSTMIRTPELKYVHRLYERDELSDLAADPGELNNVIDDPAYADRLSTLKDRLLRFYLETADAVPPDLDKRE